MENTATDRGMKEKAVSSTFFYPRKQENKISKQINSKYASTCWPSCKLRCVNKEYGFAAEMCLIIVFVCAIVLALTTCNRRYSVLIGDESTGKNVLEGFRLRDRFTQVTT
jgi:hypothetical protein